MTEAELLLQEWYDQWEGDYRAPAKLPNSLHTRTAVYLELVKQEYSNPQVMPEAREGIFRSFTKWLSKLQQADLDHKPIYDDHSDYENAIEEHEVRTFTKNSTENISKHMRRRNRVRWWRLRRDFGWLQKELRKMGRDPEDARWIL
jgi:hypothetical protein